MLPCSFRRRTGNVPLKLGVGRTFTLPCALARSKRLTNELRGLWMMAHCNPALTQCTRRLKEVEE
eukprot:363234-Chlamydomonas_euryale.AAC.2